MKKNIYFLNKENEIPKERISDVLKKLVKKEKSTDRIQYIRDILSSLNNDKLPFEWTRQEHLRFDSLNDDLAAEYLIYRYEFKVLPSKKIVRDFPLYALIEPTSVCNLRCTMCFQVDKTFTKKPFMGVMDISLFKKLIDQLVEGGTRALTLASRGEPLLHPKLPEMLDYCKDKFFDLKINTNGMKLTDKLINSILENNVNELVFSVDSFDPKEYEKIRVKGDLNKVIANIEKFNKARSSFSNSHTSTRISGVKLSDKQDMIGFKKFYSDLVDSVAYVEIENRWDTYNNLIDISALSPCSYLWERIYVWHDGTCNPCDVDYKSQLTTGNANDLPLRNIWHSRSYENLRKDHQSGNRSEYNPCDRCGV